MDVVDHPKLTPLPMESNAALLRQIFALAMPVVVEQLLHMAVGMTDTYVANHLPEHHAPAGAAVGTITYFIWFIGLLVQSIGTGSTAIIARARGARHRSLANSVCGQSMTAAVILGAGIGLLFYVFCNPIVNSTGLSGQAEVYARSYLSMLSVALPFITVLMVASACQRGAGDTLTPAVVWIVVDIVNIVCTFSLARGWWGLPVMGFEGIAAGTVMAYITGGVLQVIMLTRPWSRVRLHLHRLQPHWVTIKRLFRIGMPAGVEGLLNWLANFSLIYQINRLDPTNVFAAAHMNTIRIESSSFMTGMAFATAAATMVGQSLGMRNPTRATRSAYLTYALGGGAMTFFGLIFIFFGEIPARWISSNDPRIIELTRNCLFITGFCQVGFAASLVFNGALRGAGDTFVVMCLSLASVITIRFIGVMIVGGYFGMGLEAIWVVLAADLFIRGCVAYGRFLHGGWKRVQV